MTQAEPGPQDRDPRASALDAIIGDSTTPDNQQSSTSATDLLTSASGLVGGKPLGDAGIKRLLASGIPSVSITATGCFTYKGGLAFSYFDPEGQPYTFSEGKPFVRYRASWSKEKQDAAAAELEELPKYLSPPKCGCCKPFHSPLHIRNGRYAARLRQAKFPIVITEGEIKTLVASLHEIATGCATVTIGLGGVSAWSDQRTDPDEDGDRQLIPELLDGITWQNRIVYLAFDSDLTVKPTVQHELGLLAIALHKLGARVYLVRLPTELPGTYKDPKNGVDDFIIRHGYGAFRTLLSAAVELDITYTNRPKGEGGGKLYAVKNLSGEPGGKSESHIKALLSWSVLKETIAVRQAVGAYQWQGTHWQELEGKTRECLALHQEQLYDAQHWVNRVGAVFNNSTAEIERRLSVAKHRWQPRHLLTFTNCVLDTQTGEVRPHDRSTFTTSCLPYPYDTNAKCPLWLKFLGESFGGDANLVELTQALFRWCLMPKDAAQPFDIDKAFNMHGRRGTGKGTCASTLRVVVGPVNVGSGGPDVFGDKEKLARLVDKKVAMDMDAKGFLPSSTNFNKVVSNEPVTVERKYKDSDDLALGVVVVWASNDPIQVSNDGAEGVGRRLITIPFDHKPKTVDSDLKRKLTAEAAGIFQWAWSMPEAKMRDVLQGGIKSESAIQGAVDQLLNSNTVLRWLSEQRPNGTEGFVGVRDLYVTYSTWIQQGGHKSVNETNFGKDLRSVNGAEFKRSNGSKVSLPPMRRKLDSLPSDGPDGQPVQLRFYDYAAHLGIGMESDGQPEAAEPVHLDSSQAIATTPVREPVQTEIQSQTAVLTPVPLDGQVGQVSEKTFFNQEGMGGYPSLIELQCNQPVQPSNLSTPSVPEPLVNPEFSTVQTWVSAAIDGLGDIGATVDDSTVYSVIKSWARAPAVSRAQVRSALERIKPAQQDAFDF